MATEVLRSSRAHFDAIEFVRFVDGVRHGIEASV